MNEDKRVCKKLSFFTHPFVICLNISPKYIKLDIFIMLFKAL